MAELFKHGIVKAARRGTDNLSCTTSSYRDIIFFYLIINNNHTSRTAHIISQGVVCSEVNFHG
jgi:hypothetical protein